MNEHIFFCIYMHILFPLLLLSLHKIEDYGYGDGASSANGERKKDSGFNKKRKGKKKLGSNGKHEKRR